MNLEPLELGPQPFAADAKNFSSAGTVSSRVLEDGGDQLLFHFLQRHWSDRRCLPRNRRLAIAAIANSVI